MTVSNFLKKIRVQINNLFTSKDKKVSSPETTSPEPPSKISSHSGIHIPGFDCPRCSYRIPTTMAMLLSGQPIHCTACGLKISVEQEQSKDCLNEVKKLYEAVKKVEKVKADVGKG